MNGLGDAYWYQNGTLYDVSDEGGMGDHVGFFFSMDHPELFGLTDSDVTALRDMYESTDWTDKAQNAFEKTWNSGAIRIRIYGHGLVAIQLNNPQNRISEIQEALLTLGKMGPDTRVQVEDPWGDYLPPIFTYDEVMDMKRLPVRSSERTWQQKLGLSADELRETGESHYAVGQSVVITPIDKADPSLAGKVGKIVAVGKGLGDFQIKVGNRMYEMTINDFKVTAIRQQQQMRFDMDARVEVWVMQSDLESDDRIDQLKRGQFTLEQKIASAKLIAIDIANEQISMATSGSGVEITTNGPSASDVNIDTIDWEALFDTGEMESDEEYPPVV